MRNAELTLIIGGARSGKSTLAERLAAQSGQRVWYAATLDPGDEEMARRVVAHRSRRPSHWQTIEAPIALTDALRDRVRPGEVVLLDCLTLWTSNLLLMGIPLEETIAPADEEAATKAVTAAVDGLLDWHKGSETSLIVVTNEVGSGLVPPYPLGRLYRDLLGMANQRVAAVADRVYSVTAGLALELKGLGARPVQDTVARGPRGNEVGRA